MLWIATGIGGQQSASIYDTQELQNSLEFREKDKKICTIAIHWVNSLCVAVALNEKTS